MADSRTKTLFETNRDSLSTLTIGERQTDEIVLAFVGPVGSGVTTTCMVISKILADVFKYNTQVLKVSDIIHSSSSLVNVVMPDKPSEKVRVETLQKAGSALREMFGANYLAEKCVDSIARHRVESGGYREVDGAQIAEPRRQAYLIDSLKHPDEIELLRSVYGDVLWVFGIFAPQSVRENRLDAKGVSNNDIDILITVDEDEKVDHGQKVRDTIQLSDFFIRNDCENTEQLEKSALRYMHLLFDTEIITPKQDETGMYNAAAAAAGSACLSRQVGAAVYSTKGELIGKGRNDVPKPQGGLYRYEDGALDHRCYKWHGKICHNDDRKEMLYREISRSLTTANLLQKGKDYFEVRAALRATDVKNLIEYSRAVHAEMDAIISVARGGKPGLVGGTIYVTTFPCHSCARHIVASGLMRVIYIEPYPKSLALQLHSDSISTNEAELNKVTFMQYEGVAPKNMLRLFGYRDARKKDGKAADRDPATAAPISRSPLDGFYRLEQIVVGKLKTAEEAVNQ